MKNIPSFLHEKWKLKALSLWLILFLITAFIMISGSTRTVLPAYQTAAFNWLRSLNLYDGTGVGGFVYFPQAAILFIPFTFLPPLVGEVLWRFINIAVFVIGLHAFSRMAKGQKDERFFFFLSLICIPLVWDCARNGQATLAMTGLMLLAVHDLADSRRWRATLWLSLAVSLKPLVIILILLLAAIDRAMTWRILIGMSAVAILPFALQHPGYVVEQYRACLQNTTTAAHIGVVARGWTTPFTALRVAGIDIAENVQTILRITAAFGTLWLCILARRWYDPVRSAMFLFFFSVLYIILFSPRTENNTYMMLGPIIGFFLAEAFLIQKRLREGSFLVGIAGSMLGSRVIERLVAPKAEAIWLSPFLAILLCGYVLMRFFQDKKTLQDNKNSSFMVEHQK
ncbi:MAG: glycosyltransferase family 87 protein [Nitrospirota bacterium]